MSLSSLGFVDVQTLIRQLNGMQPMSRDQASEVVRQTFSALTSADAAGGAAAQAGEVAKRNDIKSHLQWHSDRVGSGPERYASDADLASWATKGWIAFNAAAASDQRLGAARDMITNDAFEALKNVPVTIGEAVGTVAATAGGIVGGTLGGIFSGLLSNPVGLAVVAGALYIGYKYLTAGGSVGIARRLGGRR